MGHTLKNKYDIVIIGAGIGGLVSGCYLAKEGYKVLIAEKNHFIGGSCSSFKRDGFSWDVGPHYLCDYEKGGLLGTILEELNIDLEVVTIELTDLLFTPDYKVYFWKDFNRTTDYFAGLFPQEALKIKEFIDFIIHARLTTLVMKTTNRTFADILDEYFDNPKLKSIFGMLLLGNKGIVPQLCSALTGIVFYRKYIFGGGYYPVGGLGSLARSLKEKYLLSGGEIILRSEVKKIAVRDREIKGVYLGNDIFIECDNIISACDLRRTFLELIDRGSVDDTYIENLKTTEQSLSALICHIGTMSSLKDKIEPCGAMWYAPAYNLDETYMNMEQGVLTDPCFLLASVPSMHDESLSPSQIQDSVILTSLIKYQTGEYWKDKKNEIMDILIKTAAKMIPDLPGNVEYKMLATPSTLFRYTYNYQGALQGWKPSVMQTHKHSQLKSIPFKGLFVAGHWTAHSQDSGMFLTLYSSRELVKSFMEKHSA